MGRKLKIVPVTQAEFKKNIQTFGTKLEKIEYLNYTKVALQKKLKEYKYNEGKNNILLQKMVDFADKEINRLGELNSSLGIVNSPNLEKQNLVNTVIKKYDHQWEITLKLQRDLVTSNEYLDEKKIDLDQKNSKLINKGVAGEIDNDFEANAYYLLTQKPPKGWESKRSNTGKSVILFKTQTPTKIENSYYKWIFPILIILAYGIFLSNYYKEKDREGVSSDELIVNSKKIVPEPLEEIEASVPPLGKYKLRIISDPKGAKVRIMNIKPKFKQGIELIPSKYILEVTNISDKVVFDITITNRDVTKNVFFRKTKSYPNGDEYVGVIIDGERYGKGMLVRANGEQYIGVWKYDKENGQGSYTNTNGDKYVGKWKDGKHHGQGTFTWSDVGKYEGEYKNGKRTGQGTYTNTNGAKYVGEFENGTYNGKGKYILPNGDKYVGKWKDGKFHGQGTYTYSNGKKYVGKWMNGAVLEED
jgi:hypothetical protein